MAAPWISRTVVGIVLATFWSDVGHEMVTAVLPLYLASIGLGPAALGAIEGAADLAYSLSKLGGGIAGQHIRRKRPWMAAGYALTMLGTGLLALARGLHALIALRTVAWIGRGLRSPLRDFVLADEVGPTHFGRAYGLERSADMAGAVAGPLIAGLLVATGADLATVILWSLIPSGIAVIAVLALTADREAPPPPPAPAEAPAGPRAPLPRAYWLFVGGVLLFGLGDFSRTFLIVLGARALGAGDPTQVLTVAVLLYAGHNLVSAIAAYPAGRLGDAGSRPRVLVAGYALGVITNVLLALTAESLPWLVAAICLSGIYIAIEETLEKAVVAQLVPRAQRSLGLGVLASANALGDLGSSVTVGLLLAAGEPRLAFLVPAAVGALGTAWMMILVARRVVR